jgi:RimJ/RimL family protein N-acetyltransferase
MDLPSPTITLRPATPGDRFMIRRWLADPDIETWWGSRASAEAEIALAMESPSALCRIIEDTAQPVGYAHAVDAGLWGETLPKEIPPGCWDLDIFIGSATHRAQDSGQRAIELLAREVFATTLAVACCIVISVKNEAAVRAYERTGFRWLSVWNDPASGPSWVLLKERSR